MYNLPYHKDADPKVIEEFIGGYPFALLTGCGTDAIPVATQVPLLIEKKNARQVLRGHIMRNTDHYRSFLQNKHVLAVFSGPHTYVSGSWYSDPHMASTWNYMSVHVHGNIHFLDGNVLEEVLRKTALHFENNNPSSPALYDHLPENFLKRVLPEIVAFEIEISKIDHVFKLSQDRDYNSYRNIIKQLREKGADGLKIAAEMERRLSTLFPDQNK